MIKFVWVWMCICICASVHMSPAYGWLQRAARRGEALFSPLQQPDFFLRTTDWGKSPLMLCRRGNYWLQPPCPLLKLPEGQVPGNLAASSSDSAFWSTLAPAFPHSCLLEELCCNTGFDFPRVLLLFLVPHVNNTSLNTFTCICGKSQLVCSSQTGGIKDEQTLGARLEWNEPLLDSGR